MTAQVLTDQKDITRQRLGKAETPALAEGQARLSVEMFALTANNVTYAATGFDIGYWKFFPTSEDGQGIVPVWGFARVEESRSDALVEGERLYGFWPMAESLVIEPEALGKSSVRDAAAHRDGLPEVYNRYSRTGIATASDAYRALLQPLIATSWLIADWLEDNAYFGAEQIIVGSASSKTGLGLCRFLRDAPVSVASLTATRNAWFVTQLGYSDTVMSYDRVADLAQVPSVYVDMAGDAAVKRQIHAHLGDLLKHSSAVGLSHWDSFAPPKDLDGPKPQFFFAPAQIAKRREDWGPGVIDQRIAAATDTVAQEAANWLNLVEHQGLEAGMAAFEALATGRADPRDGHIVRL